MIASFSIGNFKAFGPAQKIPIKPITLIFGPNSAGKSSIIHSLLFAHESLRTGKLDIHRTALGGKAVDLGGFEQMTYCCNPDNAVTLSLRFRKVSSAKPHGWNLEDVAVNSVLQTQTQPLQRRSDETDAQWFQRLTEDSAKLLEAIQIQRQGTSGTPRLRRFEITAGGSPLIQASSRPDGSLKIDTFATDHPASRLLIENLILASTMKQRLEEADEKIITEVVGELLPRSQLDACGFSACPRRDGGEDGPSGELFGTGKDELRSHARLFFPRIIYGLLDSVITAVRDFFNSLEYLGPLRAYPPRHQLGLDGGEDGSKADGGNAWRIVLDDPGVREKVNRWLSSDFLQTKYELGANSLVPLHLAADALETEFQEIVTEKKLMHDEDRPATEDPEAMDRFYFPYDQWDVPELYQRMLGQIIRRSSRSAVPELTLRDKRTGTYVSHRDIGIGVSQLVPVLVNAYASKRRVMAIEQPEIHLHPALQAELGDLFIESALGDQKNTFILETHSEHLILRMLKRIRETSEGELPPGQIPIHPEELTVLYVKPATKGGAEIVELAVTSDGDFSTPWPDGFFPERSKELF
jgi:hypothetical protein